MPQLFISYRRGTSYIQTVMERLKQANFAIWFDKVDIPPGSLDWLRDIERGIDSSDALILCLTEDAARSEYVQEEVKRARDRERDRQEETNNPDLTLIYPVLLQEGLDGGRIAQLLDEVGLSGRRQCVDLSMPGDTARWDAEFASLINAMRDRGGITPTHHDFRDLNQDSDAARLHQRYLRYVSREYGQDSSGTELGKLYVLPPTDYKLVLHIEDYDIADWGIIQDASLPEHNAYSRQTADSEIVNKFDNLKSLHEDLRKQIQLRLPNPEDWNQTPLKMLLQQQRQELDQQKKADLHRRLGRLDDVWRVIALDAIQIAAMFRRVMFVSEVGTGKTMLAHHLASTIASQTYEKTESNRLAYFPHHGLTPIYIHFGALARYLNQHNWDADGFWGYINDEILTGELAATENEIRRDLEEGRCIVILNELETLFSDRTRENDQRRQQIEGLIQSGETQFPGTRIMVLSREKWPSPTNYFVTASLIPFDPPRQHTLLKNYFSALYPEDDKAEVRAEQVMANLQLYQSRLPELAGSPHFIASLAAMGPNISPALLHKKTIDRLLDMSEYKLPAGQSLANLIEAKDKGDAKHKLLKEILIPFAYEALQEFPSPSDADEGRLMSMLLTKAYDYSREQMSGGSSDHILHYINRYSGLMMNSRFTHDDFQRYLAAEYLLEQFLAELMRGGSDGEYSIVRKVMQEAPYTWREAVCMVGDLLADEENEQTRPDDLVTLIEELADDAAPKSTAPDDPRFYSAWIAARIAIDQQAAIRSNRRIQRDLPERIEKLKAWLKLLLKTPGAPQLPNQQPGQSELDIRVEVGRLLGLLDDDRPGVSCVENVPSIEWHEVPAGQYIIGLPEDNILAPDDLRETVCEIPGFCISRYPVTCAQYEAFVQAGGYDADDYWTLAGLEWRRGHDAQPDEWENASWHIGNHPVIHVTWYEAQAFCAWLNDVMGARCSNIRLPSEAEWEIAARGTTGAVYLGGDDYDPVSVNGRLAKIERTTAVGLFPQSNSPFGVADMSGNVYEWCADIHPRDDTIVMDRNPVNADFARRRALRGGSWRSYPGFLRTTARYWAYPYTSTNYWGFRVICDL